MRSPVYRCMFDSDALLTAHSVCHTLAEITYVLGQSFSALSCACSEWFGANLQGDGCDSSLACTVCTACTACSC